MDELVALVSQKTGLPPEQARTAAETVLGFLKTRLPAPLAGQLDSLLAGSATEGGGGGLGDVAQKIGGLLGK